jgi:tRNA-binding EMAP/Myf-like protein
MDPDRLSLRSKQKKKLSMTISYNWLCDYLPVSIEPERLSRILTSIGLEVEGLERYEAVTGGLEGLVIGEVLECGPHPNADKLKLTRVNSRFPSSAEPQMWRQVKRW